MTHNGSGNANNELAALGAFVMHLAMVCLNFHACSPAVKSIIQNFLLQYV